ncbi:MAG: nitrogenase iron-molybdenum cofactor biosynthesis protein NifE [Magnetococcales bacterium]|nr:nitrogenase iron-molybdenum cofactor biosynthesis protein NifE [Magnetococcales bacterium]NGZ25913.1 nitrogenase iron-molybdenum cofactor biosynthesis protein NifE [Magnetococcales bacterium]
MKNAEIARLLDEPACSHNTPDKVACGKLKPGATAGGCSFDGAQITLFPISDAAHIVHGPIACAGSSWNGRGSRAEGRELHRLGLTTDLSEQEIIMGRGEKKLLFAIKTAVERWRPAAVFVYQTCVTALIGDDLEAVCRVAQDTFGLPVILVDAAGFYGTKNLGNRIAGDTLVKRVIGTRDPAPVAARPDMTIHTINLVGEFNIAGEFWHVAPLLDELGLRVLCTLAGDARFHEVQSMHRAEVTMLVCSKALINVARKLEEKYGIPWFEGSFYGMRDTSDALRSLAKATKDTDLQERTEAVILREEARLRQRLLPWQEQLRGKRALLYTGGVKSWSVVSALQDLGMTVVATGVKKSTQQDRERIHQLMGEEAILIEEGNPRMMLDLYHQQRADVFIAGGRNMYTALKARLPFLDINQEREHAYAGYEGLVELARQLVLTINSPIWERMRRPAPWSTPLFP